MANRIKAILTAALLAGCGDSSGPDRGGRDEADLTFVRLQAGASLETQEASFWAVYGQDRTLLIGHAGETLPDTALEFYVGAQSLMAWPDGRSFEDGDSVLITVRVDQADRYRFEFQPAGLVFSSTDPAVLLINYAGAGGDLNADGTVDAADANVASRLGVWKLSAPGVPWLPVPTLRLPGDRVEAWVTSFTIFGVAS